MHQQADLTDKFVGQYIRVHRTARNLSQEELGQAIGVSGQEIEEYETGSNRVGAGRLAQIAKILEVPIEALFGIAASRAPIATEDALALLGTPYAIQILRSLSRIEDISLHQKIAILTEDIANQAKD